VYNGVSTCSETWPVRTDNKMALQQAEMKIIRWTCDVKVTYRFTSNELRQTSNEWYNYSEAVKSVAMVIIINSICIALFPYALVCFCCMHFICTTVR